MSKDTVKAGAAYEAVLTDKVTPNVNTIIKSLGRLEHAFGTLRGPAGEVNASLGGIATAMGATDRAARRSTGGLTSMKKVFGQITQTANNAGQAIGQSLIHVGGLMKSAGMASTGAAAGIAFGLYKAADAAGNYEEAVSAAGVAFDKSAKSNIGWAEKRAKTLGRSRIEMIQGMSNIRTTLDNIPIDPAQLDKMTRVSIENAQDLAAMFNVPDSEGLTAVRGALGTSPEIIKRLAGLDISDRAVKARAAQEGMGKNPTEVNKQLIRFLLLEEAIRKKIRGQAMREKDSFTSQMKKFGAAVEDFNIELGRVAKPKVAKFFKSFSAFIKAVSSTAAANIGKIVGSLIVLAGVGSALLVVGTAMSAIGVAVIAMGSVIASVSAGVLLLVGAIGAPFAAIALGIGVALLALTAFASYLVISNFPFLEFLKGLGRSFQDIANRAEQATEKLETAFKNGDWETVWDEVFSTSAFAISRLANEFEFAMKTAFKNAVNKPKWWNLGGAVALGGSAREEAMRSRGLAGGYKSAVTGPSRANITSNYKPSTTSGAAKIVRAIDATLNLANRFDSFLKSSLAEQYRRLAPNWKEIQTSAGLLKFDLNDPSALPRMPDGNTYEGAYTLPGKNYDSLGSTSSMFARNSGLFGPVISGTDQLNKGVDGVNKKLEDQIEATKDVVGAINGISGLTFT